MDRWTIKQLKEMNDVQFAMAILNERRAKVNAYSPLGQKLDKARHTLSLLNPEKIVPKTCLRDKRGVPRCPTCESYMHLYNGAFDMNKFCGNCGQALKLEVSE